MGSNLVVFPSPAFNQNLRLQQSVEDLEVQQFVSELSIETLDISILPGASRFDVKRPDSHPSQPLSDNLGRKLAPVVGSKMLGCSSLDKELSQFLEDRRAVEFSLDLNRQTLSGVLIHQSQHPESSAVVSSRLHEIVTPNMVSIGRPQSNTGSVVQPQTSPLGLFGRYLQAFSPPQSFDPLVIHLPAFPSQ